VVQRMSQVCIQSTIVVFKYHLFIQKNNLLVFAFYCAANRSDFIVRGLSKRCSKRASRLMASARPSNFTACNFETQAVMRQSKQRTTTAARDVHSHGDGEVKSDKKVASTRERGGGGKRGREGERERGRREGGRKGEREAGGRAGA
jgi:hypothetical protein